MKDAAWSPVSDVRARLGEGPVWDAATGTLLWVDILAGSVRRYHPSRGSTDVLEIGRPVGVAVPRASGGLVLAANDGFRLIDDGADDARLIASIDVDLAEMRLNDGACDTLGRFWAGSVAYDARPGAGTLYRLGCDSVLEVVLTGLTVSNGIAWSQDDRTMYFVDSATQGVDAFDFDLSSGRISARRRLITIDPADGAPDGLAVDAEGHVWVALWDGWAVRRYSPSGKLAAELRLPVARVTSVAFGGRDLLDLFITTAWDGLSSEQLAAQPHAGGLFHVRVGVAGLPAHPYAG